MNETQSVKIVRTGDNTLTVTFSDAIKDFVAPLEQGGEIPAEYLAMALTRLTAAKAEKPSDTAAAKW